jgi:hypothetical protein
MDLASLCQQYLPRLQQTHGHRISPEQWRAFHAITCCRTGLCGDLLLQCPDCRQPSVQPRSCGHRACNRCQQHCAQDWLARQTRKLLPVPYFLVTFTLPKELRPLARQQPRVVYDLLMQCAASTLQHFGHNARAGHTELGLCAVLHTHTRRQDYHPHVHVVVPAGGVDRARRQWRRPGDDYLFNGRALAAAFRGALLNALATAGLTVPVVPKRWVVHCKKVGQGLKTLQYLSRYLYRGVISNHQLVADDGTNVTFRYKDSKSGKRRTRTLPGEEFLWLVLQHVLPKGFRRARDYGFLHGNAKTLLATVQWVLRVQRPPTPEKTRAEIKCPLCQGLMRVIGMRRPVCDSG